MMASMNTSLTDNQMNAHNQSYLTEESMNTEIGNKEALLRNQIANEQIIANEQNQATAENMRSQAYHGLADTYQKAQRDKTSLTTDNEKNNRTMQVINEMSKDYEWGLDPETDKYKMQYILDSIST